jgi:ligand-binding sensor domain-containing protein
MGMPAFALDPDKVVTQFVHTSWTEKDGAPGYISSIAQTTDGYLWLRTASGLVRFDGVRFVKFEPRDGERFPTSRMDRLLDTSDGSLWILFVSGCVTRIRGHHITTFCERDGLPSALSIAEKSDGTLIAGTAKGLARFKDGVWKDVTAELNFPGKQASRVFFDRAGTLWVRTGDRIVYLRPEASHFVDPGEVAGSAEFAQAPDGTVWIAEVGRSVHTIVLSNHEARTEVRVGADSVLFDRKGSLWIGSAGDGLRRVAHPERINGLRVAEFGKEADAFTTRDGLSADYIFTLFEDRERATSGLEASADLTVSVRAR